MTTPAAVGHVGAVASKARETAVARLLAAAGGVGQLETSAGVVRKHARLTVNFHPDRRDRDGRTVAEGLLADGRYRPQWETGLSNGGRFAVPGGARPRWESDLFGRVYDNGAEIRPIYGALDLTVDHHGGSPRFGSSFLVLADPCFERATFCVGDSHLGPTDVGTIDEFMSIVAGLIDGGAAGDGLGRGLSVSELVRILTEGSPTPASSRDLDNYIEAQIHGPVARPET